MARCLATRTNFEVRRPLCSQRKKWLDSDRKVDMSARPLTVLVGPSSPLKDNAIRDVT